MYSMYKKNKYMKITRIKMLKITKNRIYFSLVKIAQSTLIMIFPK